MTRESEQLRVGQFMSQPLVDLDQQQSIRVASEMMAERRISSVVVTCGTDPGGIFSERDMVACVAARQDLDAPVLEVMTRDLVTCTSAMTLNDALKLMQQCAIRHLVVVDQSQRAVGIMTQTDVVRATRELFRETAQEQADRITTVREISNAINHAMNQPLTGVLGHVDMMLLSLPEDSELRKHLAVIRGQAVRMQGLVTQLREISSYRTTVYREKILMLDIDRSTEEDQGEPAAE